MFRLFWISSNNSRFHGLWEQSESLLVSLGAAAELAAMEVAVAAVEMLRDPSYDLGDWEGLLNLLEVKKGYFVCLITLI